MLTGIKWKPYMINNFSPRDIDKARDRWLDPGNMFDEIPHDEHCNDENCEGDCYIYLEPDYEAILEDKYGDFYYE